MSAPQCYFQPGGIAEKILNRCSALRQPFHPTLWATNAHVQSAVGVLRTLSARGSYRRQRVLTSDGGTLALDWWCGADLPGYAAMDAPIVLLIHGINGGSHEGYVKWACVAAAARGWRPVVLNMRGCNGLPLTSPRGYTAINTPDVHVAIHSIRSRFPHAPLMAVGYSLGSVLLAKYLAEADNGLHDAPQLAAGSTRPQQQHTTAATGPVGSGIVAAALVSPPVCLYSTNSKLGRANSINFGYNLAVAAKLREYVRQHADSIAVSGADVDIPAMLGSWTVESFDDAVTLHALGYAQPADYYRHACSTNYLPHVRTPTLILASLDDPFLGMLPREQAERSPFLLLAATRRGGHLAFLQGWWPLSSSYCDAAVDGWLSAALEEWWRGCEASGLFLCAEEKATQCSGRSGGTNGSSSSGAGGQQQQWQQQRAVGGAGQHNKRQLLLAAAQRRPPRGAAQHGPAALRRRVTPTSPARARASTGGQQPAAAAAAAAAGAVRAEAASERPSRLPPPSWTQRAGWGGWVPPQLDAASLASARCSCGQQAPLQSGGAPGVAAAVPPATTPTATGTAAPPSSAGAAARRSAAVIRRGIPPPPGSGGERRGLRDGGAWAPFEGVLPSPSAAQPQQHAAGAVLRHWLLLRPLRSRL